MNALKSVVRWYDWCSTHAYPHALLRYKTWMHEAFRHSETVVGSCNDIAVAHTCEDEWTVERIDWCTWERFFSFYCKKICTLLWQKEYVSHWTTGGWSSRILNTVFSQLATVSDWAAGLPLSLTDPRFTYIHDCASAQPFLHTASSIRQHINASHRLFIVSSFDYIAMCITTLRHVRPIAEICVCTPQFTHFR